MTQEADWPWPDDVVGRVQLIGPWSLRVAAGAVHADDLAGVRPATCLARLSASAGEVVARDDLALAVWGEERPATWASALRNLISTLRRTVAVLPGVQVETSRAGLSLHVEGGATSDLALLGAERDRIEGLRRSGDLVGTLEGVTRLLQASGRAVAGGLVGPWADQVRTEVEEHRVRLARLGSETALRLGDAPRAVGLARLAVDLRPREEAARQTLMRALHAAGDRAAALDTYTQLRDLLSDELGSSPSQATEEVFLDVLRNAEAESVRDRRRLLPYMTGRLRLLEATQPLVGRDDELDVAVTHLLAPDAASAMLLLTGAPGIGKSRLAAAVAARAHADDVMVLHGRADSRVAAPYATIAEALDGHLGHLAPQELADLVGNHSAVLSRYLPSCRALWPSAEPTGSARLERLHAETALVDLLTRLAAGGRTMLVLDDLQWTSTSSVHLIEALLRGPAIPGLSVLAVQRGTHDAVHDDTAVADDRLRRLPLGPLNADAVRALADTMAPPFEEDPAERGLLAEALWRIGAGHPLVTTTLLRGRSDGIVRLSRPQTWGPLTQELMSALPADTASVLRVAAAADGALDAPAIAHATGLRISVVSAIMAGAAGLGLVIDDDARYTRARRLHPTIAAAVRERLSPVEREAIRNRLATAADTVAHLAVDDGGGGEGGEGDASGALPRSLDLALGPSGGRAVGDWRRHVRAAVPAMRSAIDRGEYPSAVDTGLAAYQVLERVGDPDAAARWQVQILLGEAWRALGDERAHATLHDVVDEARAAGDVLTMAEAALAFTATGTGTDEAHLSDTLLALYEEVLAALGDDEPGTRARLLGHLGTAYGWRRSLERATEATTRAITLAEELGDPSTLISVYTTGRRALAGSGMVDHQEFYEQRLLQLTADYNDPPTRVRTAIWRFESQVQRGNGELLDALLDPDETALRMVRDTGSQHSLLYSRAALLLLRGDLGRADDAIERAAAVGRRNASAASIVEAIRLVQLLLLRWEQGRLPEIRDEMATFCASQDVPEWWGPLAFVDAELGHDADIPRTLDLFFSGFDRAGVRIAIPHGMVALMANPVRRLGQAERAARLYDVLLPARDLGGYVGCFSGPIALSLGVLADTLGDTALARTHLSEAVDFSRRLGAPRWLARCEDELTRLG